MAIRAIISDYGGVLTVPLVDAFEAFHDQSGIAPGVLGEAMEAGAAALGGAHPLFELECGRIPEERFIEILRRNLAPELGLRPELDRFKEIFFEALGINTEMLGLLTQAKAEGYRMALLTNNVREWEPLWRSSFDVDGIFETVVDSGFVGMRKPDPAIYELTLDRLEGISAAECLFIDDMEVNCEAARTLGMEAVRFTDNNATVREIRARLAAVGSPARPLPSAPSGYAPPT